MAKVESELEAAVAAPASGGRDPTSWLPDELLIVILLLVPFEALWTGRCAAVCRRWRAVVESTPLQQRKRSGKWEAYTKGWIEPRKLIWHASQVWCIALGLGGTIYSGSYDSTVRVWSGEKEIRTLKGPTDWVLCLAVGPDGNVYSGSADKSIRVWSGDDGAHICTLSGHEGAVFCLAVGPNDKLYTGSVFGELREMLRCLERHTDGTDQSVTAALELVDTYENQIAELQNRVDGDSPASENVEST
jgi:hypothetical protein